MRFPAETACAVENCGHRYDEHSPFGCDACTTTTHRGCVAAEIGHEFAPRRLAGGALTPQQEWDAYHRAMRER